MAPVDLQPSDFGAQDRYVGRGGEAGHHGEANEPDTACCCGQHVAQPRRLVGGFGCAQSDEQLLGLAEEPVEKLLECRAPQSVMDLPMTSAVNTRCCYDTLGTPLTHAVSMPQDGKDVVSSHLNRRKEPRRLNIHGRPFAAESIQAMIRHR